MPFKQVANHKDIEPGKMIEVVEDGNKIILLYHEGKYKAFQGDCPHEGAALVHGHIKNGAIVCPLHQRHFSCKTGMHNESSLRLRSYEVVEKDGAIFINTDNVHSKKEMQEGGHPTRNVANLPCPKGNFIIGNLKQFNVPDKHALLDKWAKEQGDVYKLNFLGKKVIVSANTEINRHILKNRPHGFRRYNKIAEIMEEMGIIGAFNAEGDTWEKHRRLTAEALNYKNTKSYFPTIALMTDRLLRRWTKFANTGHQIDVQKELMRYTVDITSTIAFGYDTNTLEKEDDIIQNHLEKIFPMLNHRLSSPLPIWRYFKSKKDKEFDLALSEIKKIINRFISEAKERLEKQPALREDPTNFLEALLVQQKTEGNFTDKEVFGNVFTILLAGEDTTSNSISWIMYHLALNPHIIQKVRNEADAFFPQKTLPDSFTLVNELKYTEAVALEVIRLQPVTPLTYLEPLEDVVINGLELKKGVSVILQNKVAQTEEKNFVEPDKFIPERWISGKCPFSGAHKPEVIQTFGNGPRFCPGKNLAMVEMVIATAMICKNFDFEFAVKPDEVKEVFAFTMYPENLIVKLKRRVMEMV